jgi:hypothetical protein
MRIANLALVWPFSYVALRMRLEGQEHIPPGGPLLIASNHVAFVDPLLVAMAAWPRCPWYMAKEELFRSRVLAPWLRYSGGFPVRRASPDVWAVRTARDLLTFVYRDPGMFGDDRVYLIRQGVVRASFPDPSTPIEREAFRAVVAGEAARPDDPSGPLPLDSIDEILLLTSWIRIHPDALRRTTPYGEWLH